MSAPGHATLASVPVVIVGAGPAGVTAATLLSQYGVSCLILERYPDIYPQPRAVHCDDEVCRILARLGVYEEFAAISRPSLGIRLVDPQMRVLDENPVPPNSPHGFPKANMYDQPELEALLRANLTEQPGILLRGNAEVTGITQQGDGCVRVSFTDRPNGSEQSVVATYVLGCDGANSTVRSAIGAVMADLHFEQRWLVIDVDTDADLHQWDGLHQLCSSVRAGSYMRVGDTRYRWEFELLDGETAADYQSIAGVVPLISPWLATVPAEQLSLVRVAEYTFRARVADRWREGNVFLLGDAAHTTPPFIGQGLCAGLRDAMNLTWKLAGVLGGGLPDSALDTYQQEREPHVRTMIRLAISLGRAMTAGGRMGDYFRGVVFPRMLHLPPIRRFATPDVAPTLHTSALVAKSDGRRDLAGRLCPNPVLPQGVRLDKVIANRFALITSTALGEQQRNELERRGAVVVSAAPESELADWLQDARASAAIIRPDGTVMQAGRDTRAICDAVPSFAAVHTSATPPGPNAPAPESD
ncbi:bifunctional 3-(3-hydroxy-phenyl)propionate/3-hydroxycinnamic acid hydroxylase MhpA [Nocardia albiluteola]|uniref:bifunctional 3-(3-hydroxy-phenyl)propionate/3-hydroxycinnamic acid hydroxylase MhpA n=1 Tax=Nocardia albiluteola TaxID=2842303 RepID=UPI0027E14113|nr:bifunctional 3-(3-hydroxy-phenyl)propionate/3-hydroxycinnamic acid hydroxylase [Nocardia albiluteola]